ncbi:lipocalin-like domain-containing protein [Acidithiobacillus caldus]|jgi:predicted secreted hydrolase|uniref:AttH component of AttEFGH ABC transport system n=2 Tax=Acidithiobacillus caldus TaxID=33059 RepID=F9ZR94_ACICS|nr:carotenoid 1,2-hydratase [Acidithiobacillus caldus]AEK58892.1 AttH component of AttEFGH ABC transport system [Acidithiobacillus caldus SM-1]AIA55940.1 AttH component of AttEFGH ABC transport system [Acidithiobacillus caldus ATCC 51756]AUW33304.1 carotenoid 1,2-hydratase [Acidithiobacillus caldus]MBU2728326.1 carotenoid 1,2-hydratase [Acidithiobacillus caldus]MBU2737067.1 carotenoid 1,2-hydratase [Acidithiobacillus caldus ATCC 51756]
MSRHLRTLFGGLLLSAGFLLAPSSMASPLPPPHLPVEKTPKVAVTTAQPMRFPNAYGSHPDFPLEWWYVTGHLHDASGQTYGFQVTFFRVRPAKVWDNPSAFNPRQLIFAQAAIADPHIGHLLTAQRSATTAMDLAGAAQDRTRVWLDSWRLQQDGKDYETNIHSRHFHLNLRLEATQAALLEGPDGVSQKGPDPANASYYYSLPQLRVRGRLQINGRDHRVRGRAWLDHEWSAAYLPKGAVGWDWLGLNLDDGGAVMLFRMRAGDGKALWLAGTWRHADGRVDYLPASAIHMRPTQFWTSPSSGAPYPIAWAIRAGPLEFHLQPLMADQQFRALASTGTTYWEGAVTAWQKGRRLGSGYLELTGYAKALQLPETPATGKTTSPRAQAPR